MDFTEINSRGKRGELLGRIDRQNSRFRTAKTTIIKFDLHASFVELESAKSALNEHPPQCTTSRGDRKIVRMAVTDHSVTSRTVVQYIESVTHHSVFARTIRRRLQQSGLSARRPLLGQPLTQNHRRFRS
ncbi:transposable element Tcb1 transposase [Trichonephila clavipes]|nr:transposable element Tcb1 transposase [Trichonephila clavipes]